MTSVLPPLPGDVAIEVRGVSKEYRLQGAGGSLKAALLDRLRGRRRPVFRALDHADFTVRKGETLGIIGANGAGKSTLLALVAGTLRPTTGTIRTAGAISSLLELGAGFHPDLTGRDNVYLYGAIMGLPRARMRSRFDAIVDFAGIGPFIDQPVRSYSSGMYVRLGFAVAVEVDPDILLVDEVLAVGDVDFQRKCLDRMRAFRDAGKTLLVISHDMHAIRSISDRILLLDRGRVKGVGAPDEIVSGYQRAALGAASGNGLRREWGSGEVRFTGVDLTDGDGRPRPLFEAGSTLRIALRYHADRPVPAPVFGFAVADAAGRIVYGANTQTARFPVGDLPEGDGSLVLELPDLRLASGAYLLSVSVHSADHVSNYHRLDHAFPFTVANPLSFDGCVAMDTRWSRP
ncbi:MAG: ABC transporter ATP-binding protein [Kiritimatiellia bacterium]|jgi:ABC-type polysaccharide/polyol phosphate transport system ATPase subunit